ncbi:hypothetical protein BDR05DRAFT_950977 [Suillus weaverae]|nr:hypothetical protein BDR05DRAFT_950977 [Suillus weaverae]
MLPRFSHLNVGINIGDLHTNECEDSKNKSVVNCDADIKACEAQLLDNLMKLAKEDDISHTEKQWNQLLQLMVATIALDIDEQQCIQKFAEDNNTDSDICVHEFAHIKHYLSLPIVCLADDLTLDLDALIKILSNNETEQAKKSHYTLPQLIKAVKVNCSMHE